MAERETLADYVRRIIFEKGLNYREVSRRSGGAISHGTVGHIVNGVSLDVRKETLLALAKGLSVSEDEIFAVVSGKDTAGNLSLEEMRLLHCFRGIPLERRTDALGYLEMLFKLYGKNGDDGSKVGKNGPQSGKVYDAVAGIPSAVKRDRKAGRKK